MKSHKKVYVAKSWHASTLDYRALNAMHRAYNTYGAAKAIGIFSYFQIALNHSKPLLTSIYYTSKLPDDVSDRNILQRVTAI